MNRQITGTITLLITLASMQLASAQYTPAPTFGGAISPAMMPPSPPPMPGPAYAAPAPVAPMAAAMPGTSYGPGVPMPGAGVSYAVPAMMPPTPAPVYGQPTPYPVQPVMYGAGPQVVGPAAYQAHCDSGCDAGCDAYCNSGCDAACCDGGSCGMLGRFNCWCGSLFGNGCGGCGGGGLNGHLHQHGPYGTGGCCKPRWFDAQAEWLYWKRDFDESLPLSFQGIGGLVNVLDMSQLDFDYESGFRVTAAYIVGPGTNLEATYFDGFSWVDSAVATGNQDLFSIFDLSPGGPFDETGFGNLHTVALSSEMNSGELNLRRRFVSAGCCVHTSLLVGVRYFRLREDMIYETLTNVGSMSYQLKASNDLVGSQVGGDLAVCISPRFKIGADVKAGVYGSHSTARTTVFCTSCAPLRELESESDIAFLGEGGAFALYQISSRWTFRAGYQVLYLDRVATAVDNFNTESPLTARNAFIDNRGNAFVHGSNLGFEFTY